MPYSQRLLRGALQAHVEGQLDRVAGLRLASGNVRADLPAERVDANLGNAVLASQVRVVGGLEACLSDAVAGAVAVLAELLQLLRRDLARVPEDLRGESRVRIVPKIDLDDLDPGELRPPLVQVVHLLLADRGLDDDRRERIEAALLHLPREGAGRHVEDVREPLHEVVAPLLRHVAHPQLDRRSGDVRDHDASATVEQRATRGLDADQPELVRLSSGEVLVAGEHLQRPQPEEEHAEHGEREDAEDRDPQRELGRQPMRLAHARVRRQEAIGRSPPLLVRAARHTRTSTSGARSARWASPTILRTSACTGRASATLRTNAGRSAVTSAWPATTSSSRR